MISMNLRGEDVCQLRNGSTNIQPFDVCKFLSREIAHAEFMLYA
jgi:hypothetical protein